MWRVNGGGPPGVVFLLVFVVVTHDFHHLLLNHGAPTGSIAHATVLASMLRILNVETACRCVFGDLMGWKVPRLVGADFTWCRFLFPVKTNNCMPTSITSQHTVSSTSTLIMFSRHHSLVRGGMDRNVLPVPKINKSMHGVGMCVCIA